MESSRVVESMLFVAIASSVVVGLIPSLAAQDGEQGGGDASQQARRTIALEKFDARLERPEGWIESATDKKGALVTFRAAGDRRAQVEIRASSPIKQTRRESFFNSFHSRLKGAGFVRQQTREEAEYAGQAGTWTSYEGSSGRDSYRLVVWQLYRQQTAWLFVGFFPSEAGGLYVDDFESLLDSLSFEQE